MSLPPYPQVHEHSFTWGNVDRNTFTHLITCCYKEVEEEHFQDPFRQSQKWHAKAYAEESALEAVALKVMMITPHLLLQKSHHTSRTKYHIVQLLRQLKT